MYIESSAHEKWGQKENVYKRVAFIFLFSVYIYIFFFFFM